MGCAVAATSMGPPGGDFGALFGAGAGGNAVDNGWSWKAPSSQPVPMKKPTDVWSWSTKPAKPPAEWEQLLEIPQSGEELVEESRAAFDDLLQDAEGTVLGNLLQDVEGVVLDGSNVAPLCEFLLSSADEPAAKNLTRLIQWLSGKSVSSSAWEAVTALVCDKIKLASITNEELLEVIRDLPQALEWENDESARKQLHRTYAAFTRVLDDRALSDGLIYQTMFEKIHRTTNDAQACSGLLSMLTKTLGDHISLKTRAKNVSLAFLAIHSHGGDDLTGTGLISQLASTLGHTSANDISELLKLSTRKVLDDEGRHKHSFLRGRAVKWLACLAQNFSTDHMSVVYAELAKQFRPSHFAEYFASERHTAYEVARILLFDWLPNTDLDKKVDTFVDRGSAAIGIKEIIPIKPGLRKFSSVDLSQVAQEFERLCVQLHRDNTWKALIQAFARTGLSHEYVAYEVFAICKTRYSPKEVYKLVSDVLTNPDLTLTNHIVIVLIEHFMFKGESLLALKMFRAVPSVAITDVPTLPLTLLQDRHVHVDIFELFNRHTGVVPREWREIEKLSITPELIDLVHVIAHDVARTEALNTSQAYRIVWALYRWLQDRGADIKPLVSRALVTAGIMRPIKYHIWIPNERLNYILTLVEKIEGPGIRDRVEVLSIHMRGEIHDKVLRKRSASQHNQWMRQSDSLAKSTRFRLKKWTKLKPFSTDGGRSFWVPPPTEDASPVEASPGGSLGAAVRRLESGKTGSWTRDDEGHKLDDAFSRGALESDASMSLGELRLKFGKTRKGTRADKRKLDDAFSRGAHDQNGPILTKHLDFSSQDDTAVECSSGRFDGTARRDQAGEAGDVLTSNGQESEPDDAFSRAACPVDVPVSTGELDELLSDAPIKSQATLDDLPSDASYERAS
jgi:hypothetical protein